MFEYEVNANTNPWFANMFESQLPDGTIKHFGFVSGGKFGN